MSQSFLRGLKILDLFTVENPTLTTEEIAEMLGVSSITAYRYIVTLEDAGFVVVEKGEVRVSAKILRFVNLFWEQDQLVLIAKEHMESLQKATDETVAMCRKETKNIICTYRLESSQSLRSSFKIGQKMSIHAGAFARAIAAYLPKKELEIIKNNINWQQFTDQTIVSHDAYFKRLEEIKVRGYDISQGEVDSGVIGIAVPLFYKGKVIASIGVAMPSVRFKECALEELIRKMKLAADQIEQELVEQNHNIALY